MNLPHNWQQKTLETLENKNWGDPDEAPTGLVKRCLQLRRKPLDTFTIEDLRSMIGQQIGLPYLIPLAIEQLKENLFAEGDLYEGDLLHSVLKVDTVFWNDNEAYWQQVNVLIQPKLQEIAEEKFDTVKFYHCKYAR
ncbi:contact-dependent growth inhibition system immunity protein [Ferruginibacter sp. SUN106]|uniref:contact-dependent growth inhibition system immunity protein n=1 Tax=Ferruginibacter sp. SUN106 TaxID=2978348 RepID=UPI003D36699F